MFADSLATVPTLSTAQRTVTPSKLIVRNSTPQRTTSNPRASLSAGKVRPAPAAATSAYVQDPPRSTSRCVSRRKQRRWENSHLFDAEVNDVLLRDVNEDTEQGNGSRVQRALFQVEIRSAFHRLFAPDNASALDSFRQCAEKVDSFSHSSMRHRRSDSEMAWMNVEKRLRQVVVQSVLKNADILQCLSEIEELVVNFALFSEVCIGNEDSASDLPLLQSLLVAVPHIDSERQQLHISMKDSAFHRLLLHCVCQFHGLKSKSFAVENQKITIVSTNSRSIRDDLSLSSFLLQRAVSGLRTCGSQ